MRPFSPAALTFALATLLADGSSDSAPVWIGREGDRLFVATDDNSVKGRNTQRDPRVAISLVDLDDPYREHRFAGGSSSVLATLISNTLTQCQRSMSESPGPTVKTFRSR